MTGELQAKDRDVRKFKQDLELRDKEIQDFFDTDYKQLQDKCDKAE
jgi:hypothetical protein